MRTAAAFDGTLAYAFLFVTWGGSQGVIDFAVAIVINAVASFGFGLYLAVAGAPLSVGTGFGALLAGSLTRIPSGTI